MPQTNLEKTNYRQRVWQFVLPAGFILMGFALALRLVAGVAYYNEQDTFWYRDWAFDLSNGFFSVYARAEQISLDYPPLYLFLLAITNFFYKIFGRDCSAYLQMLLLKFWPILADFIFGLLLYRLLGRKFGRATGLCAALLWLFDPAVIFNSAFWGQTDGLLCMLLFLSYWQLLQNRPVWAGVLFAVAGLTKFQALFFLPVFLWFLWQKSRPAKFFGSVAAAAVTVLAVFLPFSVGAKNPLLLFQVYLGGQGAYQKCTLNAFNLYALFFKNFSNDSLPSPFGVSYSVLNYFVLAALAVLLALLLWRARRPCVFVTSFLWMNSLFLFTTRMHESYQFVSVMFILIAAVLHKNRSLLCCYAATTALVLANHLLPMLSWNGAADFNYYSYSLLLAIFSLLNFLTYLVTTGVCVAFLLGQPPKAAPDPKNNPICKEDQLR